MPQRIRKLNKALGISKNSEALWDILDIPVNTGDIADLEMRVDGLESLNSKSLFTSTNGNSVPKRIQKLNKALEIQKNSEALLDILDIPVNTGDIADLEMRVEGLESFKSKSLITLLHYFSIFIIIISKTCTYSNLPLATSF